MVYCAKKRGKSKGAEVGVKLLEHVAREVFHVSKGWRPSVLGITSG